MSEDRKGSFVDREGELLELSALADRPGPSLALLYGRRRVGKTFLLDHAWAGRRKFYYLAADTTAEMNKAELLRELATWCGDQSFAPADYPTWRTVFRLLVDLARRQPLVVVLDEFQYLMGHEDDVVSQFVAIWDLEARGVPLLVALSGSEVSTMDHLQSGGQPLYGRPNWSARLRPFDYYDAAKMLPRRSSREAALAYGIVGGTPRFLAAAAERKDLSDAVVQTILSPRGEIHFQVQNIVEQEKGIREPADYRAVLAAIAAGRTSINEICHASGLGDRPHVVRRALEILEGLDLVWRERNFAAPSRAPFQYRIADHAVRFWYQFVHPNRSRLATGDPREVWVERVAPFLNAYMGKVFEYITRESFARHHRRWGLPPAHEWARWEGQDRNRRSIEIDIVARLDDGRLLTGEVKWSRHAALPELHRGLQRDLEDLARSGQSWANDALSPERSAGHIYFSAAGFTAAFRHLSAEDPRIRLASLAELYDES